MTWDLAIVGGGPAGLAVALEAEARGLRPVVIERRAVPVDKACGEGVMPSGLDALERLGVRRRIPAGDCAPFEAIRYVQEDGRSVEARLPAPGGLGIRRIALVAAMAEEVRARGIGLFDRCAVSGHEITHDGVRLSTAQGGFEALLLVAADGLHSPLRRAEGLEAPASGPRRFGLRRHFAVAPWGARVEVHFGAGVEAYVTPAGSGRVGVAFLWEEGAVEGQVAFEALLGRFPALAERLKDAAPDSRVMGAGPLLQRVRGRVKDRFALVGDAAGYVDAITGEGLSLAFEGARALAEVLPAALAAGASAGSLRPYERAAGAAFARYARFASLLVGTARRPRLRRYVLDRLIASPRLFELALHHVTAVRREPTPGAV